MRKFHSGSLLTWLLLAALLAGCGQKGPLYLPKPPASSAVPEQLSPTLRP